MQTIWVRTTQNVFIEHPLGSVGERIKAYLIDWIILVLYTVALLAKLEVKLWYVWLIVLGVPWVFVSVRFEIFLNPQTQGELALKTNVIRLHGKPPAIDDYLMCWNSRFIDFYIRPGALGAIVSAVGGKVQRLADMISRTSVAKLREHHHITTENVFVPVEEHYTPTFAQVVSLTEKDIELIQRAPEANRDDGNIQPVIIITEKIKRLLDTKTGLPRVKVLYTIIKFYQTITVG